jgi:cysteine desulfurase
MHVSDDDALCSLRFSFSKYNTKIELDQAIVDVKAAVQKIRETSPVWQMYKEGLLD